MCLKTVKQANPKRGDLQRTGVGWKIYRSVFGKLVPLYRNDLNLINGGRNAVPGKEKIHSLQQHGQGYKKYTAGFHVYVNRDDAINNMAGGLVLCKVRWRGLLATGTEMGGPSFIGGPEEEVDVLVVEQIISRRRASAAEWRSEAK